MGIDPQSLYHRPPYLLLIDNDVEEIHRIASWLRKEGVVPRCVVLRDGKEANDFLLYRGKYRKHPRLKPSLILLKLQLPKMTGFEVLRYIRNDSDLRNVPVVVLSDTGSDLDRREALRIGANAFVGRDRRVGASERNVKMIAAIWKASSMAPVHQHYSFEV